MLRVPLKDGVTRLITPLARFLLRAGISPNAMTVAGAIGTWLSALYFFPRGYFFVGTLVVTIFLLSDLFDGTMARLDGSKGSRFGALLDSTLDRISDSLIIFALIIWAESANFNAEENFFDSGQTVALLLIALLSGFLISYVRAKAEGLGISCDVGIAERPERLIVLLVGTGFYGLGVMSALPVALLLLLCINVMTVIQRVVVVYRAS
ncbi:MAG: CDP-alcohol phosphatidyltransferase family protein [Actinobacteria bacterium]|nr:CDP-alcohol phosphatidyltransferase family protein [Actinomycetota bacterium]